MAVIKRQTKLSQLPKRCSHKPIKPNYLLNWKKHRPEFRKFILLHLIQVVGAYRDPNSQITAEKLTNELSRNMGRIVKQQVRLYVENLIYQGYLAESYLGGVITCTDKVYEELKTIDKTLAEKNSEKREGAG
jgi:hypothetical protein